MGRHKKYTEPEPEYYYVAYNGAVCKHRRYGKEKPYKRLEQVGIRNYFTDKFDAMSMAEIVKGLFPIDFV